MKIETMGQPDLCIYHGNCDDGFGAAWAVNWRWPSGVEYFPASYGKPPPDVTGRNVLIVDFSYPYDVLVEMSWKAKRIVILDHHKTAQADLKRLPQMPTCTPTGMEIALSECWANNMPEIVAHFDMQKSGARLAWEFCRSDAGFVPALIVAVEDRDLWRFALRDTREISAALRTYPHDFAHWTRFAADLGPLVAEGKAILRGHQKNVASMCEQAYLADVAGHQVPHVNTPYHYASDTAHELLQRFPDAPFAVAWFQRGDGMRQFSLRSEDSRLDVSQIAQQFGGGGHRNAAGFAIPA